ncbi:MAG: hypothetical protein AB7M93_30490 [Candidatus Obscuribacterales bacterium]
MDGLVIRNLPFLKYTSHASKAEPAKERLDITKERIEILSGTGGWIEGAAIKYKG